MKKYKEAYECRGSKNPVGFVTVKDFKKGDHIKIKGSNKVYIRSDYDRYTKKYHLVDTTDVWGNGRYVKGSTPANDRFEY